MGFRFASFCSGVEAASYAWERLGWELAYYSEVKPFPVAVLKSLYPGVPNLHNMDWILNEPDPARVSPEARRASRKLAEEYEAVGGDVSLAAIPEARKAFEDAPPLDLMVAGTPCQAFSMQGKREGLEDPRGVLTLEYIKIIDRKRPRWFVWENVKGVMSLDGGRTFGTILGKMGECGYGIAYRVLDAADFGSAQTRTRVFVVGHLGDWRPSARVLLDGPSSDHDASRGPRLQRRVPCITLRNAGDKNARGVAVVEGELGEDGGNLVPVGGPPGPYADGRTWQLRALTPREEERRQGFPGDRTRIEWAGGLDQQRYESVGNSMSVAVMRWLGERIQYVDSRLGDEAYLEGIREDILALPEAGAARKARKPKEAGMGGELTEWEKGLARHLAQSELARQPAQGGAGQAAETETRETTEAAAGQEWAEAPKAPAPAAAQVRVDEAPARKRRSGAKSDEDVILTALEAFKAKRSALADSIAKAQEAIDAAVAGIAASQAEAAKLDAAISAIEAL